MRHTRPFIFLAAVVTLAAATWSGPASAFAGAAYNGSAVRLQVTPREAEVFVDGYIVGSVDDYDGTFQRLPLPPGEHEIVLYREGYRTVRQKIYLTPNATYRLKYAMEKLGAGETTEPRPTPPPQAQGTPRPGDAPPARSPFPIFEPPAPPSPPEPPAPPEPPVADAPAVSAEGFGTLSIRVQPSGAEVWIDGERWDGPDAAQRLVVQVADGPHRVEIKRPGFDTFSTDVDVRRGETTTLNVSLLRRE